VLSATITVGVSATRGWQALAWAVDEVTTTGGRLVVGHVADTDSPLANRPGGVPMSLLELAEPALARAVAAARTRLGGDRVSFVVRTGDPGRALRDLSTRAALLVLGVPERSGWAARGSTTHQVVTHASCPVVVVRPVTGRRGPFAGHVVVGVDGSPPSRAALEHGFQYAAVHRRPLAAVHVTAAAREDLWFDERLLETHFATEPTALRLLAEEVEPWQGKYPEVPVRRAVYAGRAVPGLLRAAECAALLVVGDRGRGLAAWAVLGSVSHGVIDHAEGPVCIVPADDRREARP
jgi:nucleotide-binding universal stress UspA family protein